MTPGSSTPSDSPPGRAPTAIEARLELFPVDAHAFHLFWSFLPEAADAIESAGAFIRATVPAMGEAPGQVDRAAGRR